MKQLLFTILITILIIFLTSSLSSAKRLHLEKWYQDKWCQEQNGKIEFVLSDSTRVDCLTDKNAIEFDFGSKWAEAIGQALYYSARTNKKAGIVLILEDPKDQKYWVRLNTTINNFNLPIDIWKIERK